MSQTTQIIVGLVFVIGAFVVSQLIVAWRLRRAAAAIIGGLQRRNAAHAGAAIPLDYAKPHLLRVGLRDMRPRALEDLIQGQIVAKTDDGRYYLKGPMPGVDANAVGVNQGLGRR